MLNFDAADRQACTVRRQRTATPLQALVTMNDPQFVEAARVMAERIVALKGDDDKKITSIFLSASSRPPRPTEIGILKNLLSAQRKHFADHPRDAAKLARVGEYPVTPGLEDIEVAAFTVVANTILNSDQALVKR